MNGLVYTGIIISAIGLFLWLFAGSRLRGLQNSFIPVPPSRIRLFQVLSWIGAIMFFGGIIFGFCTVS